MADSAWTPAFVCPQCARPMPASAAGGLRCAGCRIGVPLRDGIYRFLGAARLGELEPFLVQYRRVRERDGYRPPDAAYYRALPEVGSGDPQASTWRVRQGSYRTLLRMLRRRGPGPLRVLDLGAGNGWLAARLAALGHRCVAVDWLDDAEDGLGAVGHHGIPVTCVQADFDDLPLAPRQFDVAVFNASLHYSPDVARTLRHARTMLARGGCVVVMDSPVFATDDGGRRMLAAQDIAVRAARERMARPDMGYLTHGSLARVGREAGGAVRWIPTHGTPSWAVRRWLAEVTLGREAARFGIWYAVWPPVSS